MFAPLSSPTPPTQPGLLQPDPRHRRVTGLNKRVVWVRPGAFLNCTLKLLFTLQMVGWVSLKCCCRKQIKLRTKCILKMSLKEKIWFIFYTLRQILLEMGRISFWSIISSSMTIFFKKLFPVLVIQTYREWLEQSQLPFFCPNKREHR